MSDYQQLRVISHEIKDLNEYFQSTTTSNPLPVNVEYINGLAASVGSGTGNASCLRVNIASDDTNLAAINTNLNSMVHTQSPYDPALLVMHQSRDGYYVYQQVYDNSSMLANNRINHATPVVTLASDDYHLTKLSDCTAEINVLGPNTNVVQVALQDAAGIARNMQFRGDSANTTNEALAVHICDDNPILTDIKTALTSILAILTDVHVIGTNSIKTSV